MRRHIANHLMLPASSLLLVACAIGALLVPGIASGSEGAAKAGQQLTLFSLVTQEQFLNHVDDRQRGYGNNPFGNFKAATATTRESNGGPFPGDQALFQFNLYSGADLKKLAGTADFTCSYSFKKNGFCDAVYQLSDGTLLATGTLDFNAKTFSLVVSGGTGKYRSHTGQLVSTPAARLSQRLAISLSPPSSAQPRTISLASVPTAEQFLNHADDRQRGYGNNPFSNFYQSKARTNEQSNGPFPGDQALFEFNVYSGNDLKKLAGSAVFNCNYGFKKRGFCNAIYQLSGGTLVASGPLDFNANNFSLVITGGTGKYRSVAGEVVATPSAHGSQSLAIALG
jgi:hypothetical protein